jgi:RNA polymerase sigma-70 factor (ECF subfamily)
MAAMQFERSGEGFPTTRWTELGALDDEEQRRAYLERLIALYWPPVYAHLRQRGLSSDESAETTEAFFVDVVLNRRLFDRADPERGRLRTLILSALERYRIDQHRRETARRNDLHIPWTGVEQEEARLRAADWPSNGSAFDRRWAMALLEEALTRCERHFRETGRPGHWDLFEGRVLQPTRSGNAMQPLDELAARHGFGSAAAAAAALQVVRRRAATLLREVIAETLDDAQDIDHELSEIRALLGP